MDELAQIQNLLKDEEDKKALVLDAIGSKCTTDSPFEIIQEIAKQLETGDSSLDGQLISGGKNNYCFRIFVDTHRSLALYAKLFLPYALWDEEGTFSFDIQRAQSEFDIMKQLKETEATKSSVATPFYVLDVKGGYKLLIAEWASETEEQWGNQFIDGHVDQRVMEAVAQGMARINLQEVDYTWGDFVRPGMLAMSPLVRSLFYKMGNMDEDELDVVLLLLKDIGEDRYDKLVDQFCEELKEERQVLCHNDIHPFNILVEPKPVEEGEPSEDGVDKDATPVMDQFGPNGSYLICDWETAMCGPPGKDPGMLMAFPSACSLAFAVLGHIDEAEHLLQRNMEFWEAYEDVLKTEGGKSEDDIRDIYKAALGNMGVHQFIHLYLLGVTSELLPPDGVSEKSADRAKASCGLVGLKLMLLHYMNEDPELSKLDLAGLKDYYKSLMAEQIQILKAVNAQSISPKKASFLRFLARRVSDSSRHEEAAKNFSNNTIDFSCHQRNSMFDSQDFGASMASFVDDGGIFDDDDFEVTDEIKRQWAEDFED